LEPFVKKIIFRTTRKLGVFDLTEAIVEGKPTTALRILNTLLNNKEKPHSILGGLFWQWENIKDRLSLERFRQGLKLLLDTDIRIKTGKLDEGFALELVIIRLSYLI
jgi:DNA polymerase III delta subunit